VSVLCQGDTGLTRVTRVTQGASWRNLGYNNAFPVSSGGAPIALTRQMRHDQDVDVQNWGRSVRIRRNLTLRLWRPRRCVSVLCQGDTGVTRVTPVTQGASWRKLTHPKALPVFLADARTSLTRQMGHDQDVKVQKEEPVSR
jgi:hypothetical protein